MRQGVIFHVWTIFENFNSCDWVELRIVSIIHNLSITYQYWIVTFDVNSQLCFSVNLDSVYHSIVYTIKHQRMNG